MQQHHSCAQRKTKSLFISLGANRPDAHRHARLAQSGGRLEVFPVIGREGLASGINEIREYVTQSALGRPYGAILRRAEQVQFDARAIEVSPELIQLIWKIIGRHL